MIRNAKEVSTVQCAQKHINNDNNDVDNVNNDEDDMLCFLRSDKKSSEDHSGFTVLKFCINVNANKFT